MSTLCEPELDVHYGRFYTFACRLSTSAGLTLLMLAVCFIAAIILLVVYVDSFNSNSIAPIVTLVMGVVTLLTSSSLLVSKSEQLAKKASKPNFRNKIGYMADIKEEVSSLHSGSWMHDDKPTPTYKP